MTFVVALNRDLTVPRHDFVALKSKTGITVSLISTFVGAPMSFPSSVLTFDTLPSLKKMNHNNLISLIG